MNSDFRVHSPAPRDAWDELAINDDKAMVFQTPRWMDAITFEGHHMDCSRLYEFPGGEKVLLPLVCTSGMFGRQTMLSSLPHGWGTGGPLFSSSFDTEKVRLMIDDLRSLDCLRLNIRPNPLTAAMWHAVEGHFDVSVKHVSHIIDLHGGFDHFWTKTLSTATRTKIRRAEKSPLVINRELGGKAIPSFYHLYMQWLDNRSQERGMPDFISRFTGRRREPESKFQAVGRVLGDKCQVWTASLERQPVAAAIFFIQGPHAVIWRSYSDKNLFNGLPVNYLLQKSLIEEACRSGCQFYHMEESGGVRTLMHFKEQFGAVGYPYKEYYLERFSFTAVQQGISMLGGKMENHLLRRRK